MRWEGVAGAGVASAVLGLRASVLSWWTLLVEDAQPLPGKHLRGNKGPPAQHLGAASTVNRGPFWGFALSSGRNYHCGGGGDGAAVAEGSELLCPASSWSRLTAPTERSGHPDLTGLCLRALVPIMCLTVA